MKAAEWTTALRSGKYEQGQNALCDGSAFCCLGVLAEVSGFEKRVDPEFQYVEYRFPWRDGVLNEEAVIPPVLQAELLEDLDLGMRVPATEIDGREFWSEDLHTRLIKLNDNGATFETIADYIDGVVNDIE
jgi:hypothetical protein